MRACVRVHLLGNRTLEHVSSSREIIHTDFFFKSITTKKSGNQNLNGRSAGGDAGRGRARARRPRRDGGEAVGGAPSRPLPCRLVFVVVLFAPQEKFPEGGAGGKEHTDIRVLVVCLFLPLPLVFLFVVFVIFIVLFLSTLSLPMRISPHRRARG